MSQFTKSSMIWCGFADIITLFLQTSVISTVISIAYQSAGQSLAKLWVEYRSHNTQTPEIQLPRPPVHTCEDRTTRVACITAFHTVTQPSHINGSGQVKRHLDTVWTGNNARVFQLTRPRTPAWGACVLATPLIRPQKFMPKSHGQTALIPYLLAHVETYYQRL